ncbi:MAG: hypothetical protein AAF847_09550 [Bacteroidota bacterium]
MKIQKLLFSFLFISLLACNSSQKAKSNNMKCDTTGTVKNFSSLDGCGLLIVLENGEKLQPMEIVDDFQLKDGQQINFSYELVPDAMSTCMAGKIIKITCLELSVQ